MEPSPTNLRGAIEPQANLVRSAATCSLATVHQAWRSRSGASKDRYKPRCATRRLALYCRAIFALAQNSRVGQRETGTCPELPKIAQHPVGQAVTPGRLWRYCPILFVVIGIPALIVPTWRDLLRGDSIALAIAGCYFAVIPLLGLFAWGMPRLAYRCATQAGAEVYIGPDGVFVNGALQTWKQPFTSLRRVRFNRQANPPALEFDTLRGTLTRLGVAYFKTYTVAVPVPAGQEALAENVALFLTGRQRARAGIATSDQTRRLTCKTQ